MKPLCIVVVFAALVKFAAAAPVPSENLTVHQAVELFSAIGALDKGGTKLVDGKEAHVPFVLSASVRYTLASDKSLLSDVAEIFQSTSTGIQAQAAAAQKKDDPAAQAKMNDEMDKQLQPVLKAEAMAGNPPAPIPRSALKKISLSDLALDTNPIEVGTLAALRLIISDQ